MSQTKLKTMLMQNFGGQTKCIMGNMETANDWRFFETIILPSSDLVW